jgi:cellulose biosynthesis protein BcsQ
MSEHQEMETGGMRNQGQSVPVVAFYSVQGGVGKTTLARKFAELVTVAPGRDGHKPNVLLVDLDVEAQGLTFRLARGLGHQNFKTVHEVMAQRNVTAAQAINVTTAVSLASGVPQQRGHLYLMAAAPPEAKGLFDTIAGIPKDELFRLLQDTIRDLVRQYDISCVIVDCAPGANPYTAAAATLADFPLLIGRNEPTTYEQIRVLPERFREWYGQFQPAKQNVIINAVSVQDLYVTNAAKYAVFDFIPLTSDVIHETEGLSRTGSLRMLLFEKYIVDIIKKLFVGMGHLIPESPEVLGQEWLEVLKKLGRCEEAPKIRWLRRLSPLFWAGAALVLTGVALVGARQAFADLPVALSNLGIAGAIVGVALSAVGWYFESQRQGILRAARELVFGGPDEVFRKLKEGVSHRRQLDEMKKLADTIPAWVKRPYESAPRGAGRKQEL